MPIKLALSAKYTTIKKCVFIAALKHTYVCVTQKIIFKLQMFKKCAADLLKRNANAISKWHSIIECRWKIMALENSNTKKLQTTLKFL